MIASGLWDCPFESSPRRQNSQFQLRADGSGKIIIFLREDSGGTELNVNGGFRWEHGGWVIDGYSVVKPGGLFQGISCFGLLPVGEPALKLNPAVRIITVRM